MAKENYLYLIGQCKKAPTIKYDNDGNPIKAQFVLTTIKRNIYDNSGMYSPKYDYPYVETENKELIKELLAVQPFDFLEVKGTFATKNIQRGKKCPHCGHMTIENGVLDYIEPIYIGIRAHSASGSDGAKYLMKCAEASNIVKLIGVVCTEPEFYTYDNGTDYAHYDLAVNRKYYVENQAYVTADFPWIKTYGDQAEKDKTAIKKGSLVYVDGYIKTEKAKQTTRCESCGEMFDFEHVTMIVRPHSVEYLEGCHLPEPEVQEQELPFEKELLEEG